MGSQLFTLRVSVLEHCQLRCSYCLPNSIAVARKNSWLSLEHYALIVGALAGHSIHKVRFTGGEPLLRSDLPDIMRVFAENLPKSLIALTTNGLAYEHCALELKSAGLKTITFHLDTLREDRYKKIMGKGSVAKVLGGIEAARRLETPSKLNVVVQKGLNDDELADFIYFGQKNKLTIRFIELMNTGSAPIFVKSHFMSGAEILARIAQQFWIEPIAREEISSPAERFYLPDLKSTIGIIASDTRPFCQNCNRLRLSADGILRTCLYEPNGLDLSAVPLKSQIAQKILEKTSFHPNEQKRRRLFSMSQTGG